MSLLTPEYLLIIDIFRLQCLDQNVLPTNRHWILFTLLLYFSICSLWDMSEKYLVCFVRIMLFHSFSGVFIRLILGASNSEEEVLIETWSRETVRGHEKRTERRRGCGVWFCVGCMRAPDFRWATWALSLRSRCGDVRAESLCCWAQKRGGQVRWLLECVLN